MRHFLPLMLSAIIFTACSGSKDKKITGTWRFAKVENNGRVLKEAAAGEEFITATFREDSTFISLAYRGTITDTTTGVYKFSRDNKYLITENGKPGNIVFDTSEVLELSATTFKMKNKDGDIITFTRK